MKKNSLVLFLLCLILLLCSCYAGGSTYREYTDRTPGNNVPDAIGRGAFPEELSEEDRSFCEGIARALAEGTDLSPLTDNGFSDAAMDPAVYYAERYLNTGNLFEGVRDGLSENFTASANFRVVFPVFATVGGRERVVAHIVVKSTNSTYSSKLYTISSSKDAWRNTHTRSILEKMPSFAALEELCEEKELGTLQAVSLIYADTLRTLRFNDYYFEPLALHLILLETDKGAFVYDPMFVRTDHGIGSHLEEPFYEDETAVFDSTTFGEATVTEIEESIERHDNQKKEAFKEFFKEIFS